MAAGSKTIIVNVPKTLGVLQFSSFAELQNTREDKKYEIMQINILLSQEHISGQVSIKIYQFVGNAIRRDGEIISTLRNDRLLSSFPRRSPSNVVIVYLFFERQTTRKTFYASPSSRCVHAFRIALIYTCLN